MESYFKQFHNEDITNLLNDNSGEAHISFKVSLNHLQKYRPELYADIVLDVFEVTEKWNKALLNVQIELAEGNVFLEPDFQIKKNCHVRFIDLPDNDDILKGEFPNNDHVGMFVKIKGSIVRMSQIRLLEFKREYVCNRCKEVFVLEAKYEDLYIFEVPKGCINPSGTCRGSLQMKNTLTNPEFSMEYQEIKVQELFSSRCIPLSLIVTLESDLTDSCQAGDKVTICGTMERRWPPLVPGKRSNPKLVMRAASVFKDDEKTNFGKDISEQMLCVRSQWQDAIDENGELNARDVLCESICPKLHGMYMVKLAVALTLCSGTVQTNLSNVGTRREQSHLLLVGDPGMGKSQLLKAASRISTRAIHTTGKGCTAAGLTAAAFKEEGEWQIEAGALVLADGGVCCIDEFNLMRETDKLSILEAMEQQSISMAKAGLVCKLYTRCSVMAATNPKNLHNMSEDEGTSSINIGISSPLLSRFDLVFILRDEHDGEWDSKVVDYILNSAIEIEHSNDIWNLERLQSHFLAIYDIKPKITSIANEILGAYYNCCRADSYRDVSRTTIRLLDSLNRLAQAHAKLLFREYVNSIDAIITIILMELSWGFGRIINPKYNNIIKSELPIGPSEEDIHLILNKLNLQHLENDVLEELENSRKTSRRPPKTKRIESVKQPSQHEFQNDSFSSNRNCNSFKSPQKRSTKNDNSILKVNDLENIFGYNKNMKKLRKSEECSTIENQTIQNAQKPIETESDKTKKQSSNENVILKLSQTLNKSYEKLKYDYKDLDLDLDLDLDFDFCKKPSTSNAFNSPKMNTTKTSRMSESPNDIFKAKESNSPYSHSTQVETNNTPNKTLNTNQHEIFTPKSIFNTENSIKQLNKVSPLSENLNNKTPPSLSENLNNKKPPSPHSSIRNQNQTTPINEKLLTNKASPATVSKLEIFKNPNFLEKNSLSSNNMNETVNERVSPKPLFAEQNVKPINSQKDDDSAYNTMNKTYANISAILKLKNEDLSSIDFDF